MSGERGRGPGRRPIIIAIEGIDGSGKTLQQKMLSDRLRMNGYKTLELSFPRYGGFFGKEIGRMLTGETGRGADRVDARSMALWYALDRFDAVNNIDMDAYDYCVVNRYVMSNMAYQGLRLAGGEPDGDGFIAAARWIYELEHVALGLPVPDVYIFLRVDAAASHRNMDKKGPRDYISGGRDVYESDAVFLKGVGRAYLRLCADYGAHTVSCARDGAMFAPEAINDGIYNIIQGVKTT